MNMKTEAASPGKLDAAKWLVILLLLGLGLVGFYYFSDVSLLLRVVALLSIGGVSVFLALQTLKGQNAWGFAQEAHVEVRKVVWPTRRETLQMTGVVILMVIIMAIMIWMIDSVLFWIVKTVTS